MAIRKDEACILTSEFKNRGDEILCGTLCYLLPVTAAPCEKDEVRATVNEGGRLFGTLMQHLHKVDWKIRVRAEPCDQSCCFGSVLGTLDDHCIARSERSDERNYR